MILEKTITIKTMCYKNFLYVSFIFTMLSSIFSCSNCYECQDECYYCPTYTSPSIICSSGFQSRTQYNAIKRDFIDKPSYNCKKIEAKNYRKFCDDPDYLYKLENDSSYTCN